MIVNRIVDAARRLWVVQTDDSLVKYLLTFNATDRPARQSTKTSADDRPPVDVQCLFVDIGGC
jgi:hypothetical protein